MTNRFSCSFFVRYLRATLFLFYRLSIKNEASTRQLVQAARSGRLNSWIERLRRHLSTLGARKLSSAGTEQLNRAGKELAEVNRRVTEITLA